MRDIRFRAWDKLDKKFVKYITMTVEGLLGVSRPESYELMQYTGLKDKNGKEIYESDIVKVFNGVCKVIYSNDICCYEGKSILGSRALYGYAQEKEGIEVIGNIYENPELLRNNLR